MRPWSKNEPARQRDYQRIYRKLKNWEEAVEDKVDYLLGEITELKHRLDVIEHRLDGDRDCEHERKSNNNAS